MGNSYTTREGICGYSAPGTEGLQGSVGTSVFYTPYMYSADSAKIAAAISNGVSLSDNPYADESSVSYTKGDFIIDGDGTILVIKSLSPITLHMIGNISIKEDPDTAIEMGIYSAPVDSNEKAVLNFKCTQAEIDNNYNWIADANSPLYHHRDTRWAKIWGNKIAPADNDQLTYEGETIDTSTFLKDNIDLFDSSCGKIVAVFESGLTCEKIIDKSNFRDGLFIENRYFYMSGVGKTGISRFSSVALENGSAAAASCATCITRTTPPPLCQLYFEYSYNRTLYRVKINVT